MPLMPKRVKHRKFQRGKLRGRATRGNRVSFGEFGLQALETGWITGEQIEAGRLAVMHFLRHEGKLIIRNSLYVHNLINDALTGKNTRQ